jgi:hypothetical protein
MKLYRIHLVKEVCTDAEVFAVDEQSAKEQALELADSYTWCEGENQMVGDVDDITPDDD